MDMKDLLKLRENKSSDPKIFNSNDIYQLRIKIGRDTAIDIGSTVDCGGKFGVNVEEQGMTTVRGCSDIYQITEFGYPQEHDKDISKSVIVKRIENGNINGEKINGTIFRISNPKRKLFPTINYTEQGDLWIEPKDDSKIMCDGDNPYSCIIE